MNRDIILRLSKYKRILQKLKALGMERVFSNNLGEALGITSALVRKDFSLLNIAGNKKGGYSIDELITEIDSFLGKEQLLEIIVVGCGKIGSAIMRYNGLAKDGISIVAGFDIHPAKAIAAYSGETPIFPISDLEKIVKERGIKVGIISVPEAAAAEVFEKMLATGISGFLNFSPVELKCNRCKNNAESCKKQNCCTINNINIAAEIENIFYYVNNK